MTEGTINLVAQIAEIMTGIKPMFKSEQAGQGSYGYKFISVNDMLDIARPKLAASGIVFYGDVETIERVQGQTRNGNEQTTIYLHVRWFVSNGTDEFSFRTIGEAADTGDKASNKAYTAAQKQAISKLLMMSGTDDDPDRDISPQDTYRAPAPPPNPELAEKKKYARDIVEGLAQQFARTKEEVVQIMVDDGVIEAAWANPAALDTVEKAQKFIDAAVVYLEPERN